MLTDVIPTLTDKLDEICDNIDLDDQTFHDACIYNLSMPNMRSKVVKCDIISKLSPVFCSLEHENLCYHYDVDY